MAESDSPLSIRVGFETMAKIRFKHLQVNGLDNLPANPRERLVIASSHTSDLDIPAVAAALSSHLNLGFANISAQDIRHDPLTLVLIRFLGKSNFYPIDYTKLDGEWKSEKFNSKNFLPMVEAIKQGKTIVIAAHNPSYDFVLPKGGYGAVWLAHQAEASLVPVAVDLGVKRNDIGKPNMGATPSLLQGYPRLDVQVNIGKPLNMPPFSSFKQLRNESAALMHALAELLPPEKRGDWSLK